MSEAKLNVQQRLFAALETLVKQTRVKEVPLLFSTAVTPIPFSVDTAVHEMEWEVPVSIAAPPDFLLDVRVAGGVEEITCPEVRDAEVSALSTGVIDVAVDTLHSVQLHEVAVDTLSTVPVRDFFADYQIKKMKYSTSVKTVNLASYSPGIRKLTTAIFPILKENVTFFRKLPVSAHPAELSYMSVKEQFYFWKKAVNKTRKEAKKLKLLGVYPGIPREAIENIKVSYSSRSLNYNFIPSYNHRKETPLVQIALFTDLETNKSVMVSK